MTVPTMDEVSDWVGLPVRDSAGLELGRCDRLYADRESGAPEWLLLHHTGARGGFFVPVRDARRRGEAIEVSWPDSVVFSSPTLGDPGALTDEDEVRLYRHYDLGSAAAGRGVGAAARNRLRQLTPGTGTSSGARRAPLAALAAALALLALALRRRRRR